MYQRIYPGIYQYQDASIANSADGERSTLVGEGNAECSRTFAPASARSCDTTRSSSSHAPSPKWWNRMRPFRSALYTLAQHSLFAARHLWQLKPSPPEWLTR